MSLCSSASPTWRVNIKRGGDLSWHQQNKKLLHENYAENITPVTVSIQATTSEERNDK